MDGGIGSQNKDSQRSFHPLNGLNVMYETRARVRVRVKGIIDGTGIKAERVRARCKCKRSYRLQSVPQASSHRLFKVALGVGVEGRG